MIIFIIIIINQSISCNTSDIYNFGSEYNSVMLGSHDHNNNNTLIITSNNT